MDYAGRLRAMQAKMRERDIDLMFLPRAANLFYVSGIRRQLEHGTDHNAYGDWLCGGYIGQEGPLQLVAPRMGGGFWVNEAESKPWVAGPRLILEPIAPLAALRETLAGFGLTAGKRRIALDERAWSQMAMALLDLLPEVELVNANEIIAPMRAIKSDDELAVMQRGSDLTDQVFENVLARLKPGVSEYDVAHEIDYQFVTLGAEYTSFETGVFFVAEDMDGGGKTIRSGGKQLQHGDSIMFDFGGLIDGYATDFGRSAFLGEPPAEYLRVHNTVVKAQADAMAAMAAGQCTAAEANRIARQIIADAGYDEGFTHRLGHGIGVTVHEPPFLDGVDETVLRERMVFTVEPSIVYKGRFGNRIEDMVVVTSDGGKPMSKVERKLFVIE
ncbi:MAG: M24 family metallopeptidase [Thermomicrobiales bacterium]